MTSHRTPALPPRIRVAAAALSQTPLDWRGNRANLLRALDEARRAEASVLCLPEMCLTGYGCEDSFFAPDVQRRAQALLLDLLPHTRGLIVNFGLPLLHRGALYNCVALVVDEAIVGFVPKQHLAADGLHYEPRWFRPWPGGIRERVEVAGAHYPIGDLLFECGGVRLGFEICEDAWVARRPGSQLALRGADVILNPSASHFAFGKLAVRKRFVLEGSRAFNLSYVYANLLGNEAGRAIYDGGALIASAGQMLAQGTRFGFERVELCLATIDVAHTRTRQASTGSFEPEHSGEWEDLTRAEFSYPALAPVPSEPLPTAPWESSAHLKEEEMTRALALALFDYMRKARARGFVVSLSGGADSTAVATLVALMVRLGADALGVAGLARALGLAGDVDDVAALTRRLLCTAYQATRNSSEQTREAAATIATALGAEHHELDVDALVVGYRGLIEAATGRALSWEQDDIALQNIQARVRAPGIWLLANLKGALLLCTSNRSEAAVGYATMDGDTCGGVSPIAGIDKAFLREWLRWLELEGPEGLGPIPALRVVNGLVPTAELRPQEAAQSDEADLMPYPILDAIERAAIRDKRSPLACWEQLCAEYPDRESRELGTYVERFFRLWCRNQWKRERYAPSFHLDDENLDPKTWCRFPILSGGFEAELEALAQAVAAAQPG